MREEGKEEEAKEILNYLLSYKIRNYATSDKQNNHGIFSNINLPG